jgi:hypothetical protein
MMSDWYAAANKDRKKAGRQGGLFTDEQRFQGTLQKNTTVANVSGQKPLSQEACNAGSTTKHDDEGDVGTWRRGCSTRSGA